MTEKEKITLKDNVIKIFNSFNVLDNGATIGGLRDDVLRAINSIEEEPVSKDLEGAALESLTSMETNSFPNRIYLPRDVEYPQVPDVWWEREASEDNVEYVKTDIIIEWLKIRSDSGCWVNQNLSEEAKDALIQSLHKVMEAEK